MKRYILLTIAMILAISVSAQKKNIVGTWNEVNPNQNHNQMLNESIVVRTWIFSADGTKTLKGRMQATCPIGGINCTFDMVQSRTDEKWTLNGETLTMVAIPLDKLTIDIDYQKYGNNYTAAQKQKINAGIPAIKQQAIKETRQIWQSFVGNKTTYRIKDYTPMRMVLNSDGQEFVLVRDVSKMTAAQKAQLEKETAQIEKEKAQIEKEKAQLVKERAQLEKETAQIEKEKAQIVKERAQLVKEMEAQTATDNEEKVYNVVNVMPSFPDGQAGLMQWLRNNMNYPTTAAENGIQGRVIVQFVVEKDGSITNVKVAKPVDPSLDMEAVRLVSTMPKWIPGKEDGSPVRVWYTVPVSFKL